MEELSRAGREPTEDIKRRLVHICRQAGLRVTTARMYLRHDQGDRLVLIGATKGILPQRFVDDWAADTEMPTSSESGIANAPSSGREDRWIVSIITCVSTCGEWSGEVDIRCSIAPEELLTQSRSSLVMRGRGAVPFEDLARQLSETLEEREQVMAALNLGVEGPYTFRRARWEHPLDVT